MSNENTNQQQSNTAEEKRGFWKRHGNKITLAATGVGIAVAGVAVGMALKSGLGAVTDLAETAAESASE